MAMSQYQGTKKNTDLGPSLAFQHVLRINCLVNFKQRINLAVIRRLLGPPFHQSPTQQLGLTPDGAVFRADKMKRTEFLSPRTEASWVLRL